MIADPKSTHSGTSTALKVENSPMERYLMILPKILAWNYRGADSTYALRHLLLMDILILEETWVPSKLIEKIIAKSQFNAYIEPLG